MNRDDGALGYDFEVKEQDRWLPIANCAKIMKSALPETAKISKEAKECIQECVSEFIAFITNEAAEHCYQQKRKTINGEDLLFAMASLGFEHYAEVLKVFLARYRENLAGDSRPQDSWAGRVNNTEAEQNDHAEVERQEEPSEDVDEANGS